MYTSSAKVALSSALLIFLLMLTGPAALATSESVIHSFGNAPDAYGPRCNLVVDAVGNMYGTTFSGGHDNFGAIFKVTTTGDESVVYSFVGGNDGTHPIAGLFIDKKTGILYGTTIFGGTTNNGTVFSFNPATGIETVLYSFKGAADGYNPYAGVVRVGTNLFGATNAGGAFGYGTVFKLTAAGKKTILHDFNSAFPALDGSFPYASMILYKGILYGTTTLGGLGNLGTVFSITKTGSYATLYTFKGGVADGQSPFGSVLFDADGNLYGTTNGGGVDNAGVVYKLGTGGETVLYHFRRNGADGINPNAGLILFKKNLYGTTTGGNSNGGTVFKLTPSGTETVLHMFTGGTTDGFNPYGALVVGIDKALYGTTAVGGTSSLGTVFRLVP
ncbi:MAG: hypothetical protein HY010_12975 [Acidobacteria bacterium]|nr:hypothetical protein [Acidobacteriota bacterium]